MLSIECVKSLLPEKILKKIIRQVSSDLRIKDKKIVSLAFVSPTVMRRLNRLYRKQDRVTDVLSFPFDNRSETIGEVLICGEVAKKQGREYGHGFEAELAILLVHGLLHLFGFDHLKKVEAKKMFVKQKNLLEELNIKWSPPSYG